MNKEKEFDCVKFKDELQKNLLRRSSAKNLQEYADYVNRLAKESPLHKNLEEKIEKRRELHITGGFYANNYC
jgi:hypothetical protein